MFASTDGLPGPLKVKRFGSLGIISPRNVTGPVRPQVAEPGAAGADRVDPAQRAGHRVEAGGEHQGVARMTRGGGVHCVGGDGGDGFAAQVDQRHVLPVERLVVAGVGADALGADGVVDRHQVVGHRGIGHQLPDAGFGEFTGDVVGGEVDELVGKRLAEQHPALSPPLPQGLLAIAGTGLRGGLGLAGVGSARRCIGGATAPLGVLRPDATEVVIRPRPVRHRHAVVR